ncbi:lipid carrier protein [Catenovulum agarivorans DS-2]|uniref:Ubiquinone biosynthesis accessory factor UbiT n=1 Tax=Catenovulum agarivorans DS-2 TaxID=1328313 RepID=W7QSH3_9ALTE|nr:SCP2 sterol-binding domain-containing protein [Catenovulum agarivorans]EWH08335.1 lipid carrier protein [Catenovulum agarivorans DS-2]
MLQLLARLHTIVPAQQAIPKLLTFGWQVLPNKPLCQLCSKALNQLFATELAQAELDFLVGKWIEVRFTDADLCLLLSVEQQQIVCQRSNASLQADVTIAGNLQAFSQLLAGKVDPDSLFFRRQLLITGDTELGLELKNFLDSVDNQKIPHLLKKMIDFYAELPNPSLKSNSVVATTSRQTHD